MKKIVLTAILAGSAVFAFAGNVSVNLGGIGVSVGNRAARNQCGSFHRFSILLLLPGNRWCVAPPPGSSVRLRFIIIRRDLSSGQHRRGKDPGIARRRVMTAPADLTDRHMADQGGDNGKTY